MVKALLIAAAIDAAAFAASADADAAPTRTPAAARGPAGRGPAGKNTMPTSPAPLRPGDLPPAVLAPPTLPKSMAPQPRPVAPATPPGTLPPLPSLGSLAVPPSVALTAAQAATRSQGDVAAPVAAAAAEVPDSDELANRVADLEQQLEQTRELVANRRPTVTVGGYVDFGFFATQGDGAGIVRDTGNAHFQQYASQYGWVFLGDLLAPTINSRGEVADLGDAVGAPRFDSVHSRGAPGFIANEINATLNAGLTDSVLATASINFIPRTGSDFEIGDYLEIDVAQLEWMPTASGKTSIFVGKFDSVIGIEYRDRKSNQRFGITPSLLARYTTGTQLGVKLRSKFGDGDWLVIAGALTNGSNTTEQFHFHNEIDTNVGKTASGRISLHYPGDVEFEIGVSGSYGAQDRARSSKDAMWFFGVDLLGRLGPVDVKAQWLKGQAPGAPMDDVYGLDLKQGAYLELDWMITRFLGVYGRGELRDALVWLGNATAAEGANRLYLTKSWRATAGLKAVLHQRIALKAEYLHNGEYGGIPSIANNLFTSSLLFSF